MTLYSSCIASSLKGFSESDSLTEFIYVSPQCNWAQQYIFIFIPRLLCIGSSGKEKSSHQRIFFVFMQTLLTIYMKDHISNV